MKQSFLQIYGNKRLKLKIYQNNNYSTSYQRLFESSTQAFSSSSLDLALSFVTSPNGIPRELVDSFGDVMTFSSQKRTPLYLARSQQLSWRGTDGSLNSHFIQKHHIFLQRVGQLNRQPFRASLFPFFFFFLSLFSVQMILQLAKEWVSRCLPCLMIIF